MDDDQYNTMLIFANYLLGMNENQTSISKDHTNNTPFVVIKTKNERKETIKEKKTNFTPKKQELKNNDFDWNQDKEVCRPLMTFTRVLLNWGEKKKQCIGFKLYSTGKLNENGEEGYKIQSMRCLFFKKTDVKIEREEKIDSLDHSTKDT